MKDSQLPKLIIVGGATGSGKTSLAINICKEINGIIINADSVQIYKYMNIGSNKGKLNLTHKVKIIDRKIPIFEMESSGINGILFDFIEPNEPFSVYDYEQYALKAIDYIKSTSKIPVIVGGTGLYIDALVYDYKMQATQNNTQLREELNKKTINELINICKNEYKSDYEKLNNSDKNNPRRLIRLIERSENKQITKTKSKRFNDIMIIPNIERDELYTKIDSRVEQMFNEGLVEEVKDLIKMGFSPELKSMQSLGYKEVISYLKGDINVEECKELIKINHKKYAKRQITWFEGFGRNYNVIKQAKNNLKSITHQLQQEIQI